MKEKGYELFEKKHIIVQDLFSDISNNFTYEFWIKPYVPIQIPPESISGVYGLIGQQWVIAPGHGGNDGNKAGVGVSVGLNGIAVFEHCHNHLPAILVYPTEITDWTHIGIVFKNKTPFLYINGIFIKNGLTSNKEDLFPSGVFGALKPHDHFKGDFNEIKIWNYSRIHSEIFYDMEKDLTGKEPGLLVNLTFNNGEIINKVKNFTNVKDIIVFPEGDGEDGVSIIIPVFNQWEYTYECLKSIHENTNGIKYEVIIGDDMSNDGTSEIHKFIHNVKVIKDGVNRGFLKNCNNAAKFASGKYLLFLNNDTKVQKNWLNYLVNLIETDESIGMVGSKLIHSNGRLQEAGSIIFNDGSCTGYGRGGDPDSPEYSYVREVHFCSGACILVKKDLFIKAGMFDEQFSPAYYEDVDLAMKIRELGYKVMFQPLARVIHHEFGSSTAAAAIQLQLRNKEKFQKKWGSQISSFQRSTDHKPGNYPIYNNKKLKILVIDDMIPATVLGSGFPRTFSILQCLVEIGMQVTYFPLSSSERIEPCTSILQQRGIEVMYDAKNKLNFPQFYMERKNLYDVIWISRPHNMNIIYDLIKIINNQQKIIYDCEALFSKRNILRIELEGKKISDDEKNRIISQEISLVNKADMVVTVSEQEKTFIQNYIKNPIMVIGHTVEVKPTPNPFENRNDILFVGGFLSSPSPNEDAIVYFVRNIYPLVYKKLKAKLWIVGTNNSIAVKKLASDNIIVTGQVDNLEDYYNKCRVFIIPTRYAAGIPLKALEAFSYGLPSIVTPLIADQLMVDQNVVLIGENPNDFAKKLIHCYRDKNIWNQLRVNELNYVGERCNRDSFKRKLLNLMNQVIKI